MIWLQPYTHVVVPSPGPLLLLAERRRLERLLPFHPARLILVDCAASFVAQSSLEFAAFLDTHFHHIDDVETEVHRNLLLLNKPVTRNLANAAAGEFLVHHLENAIGGRPAVLICETRRDESDLAKAQQFFPAQIKLMTLDGYLRSTELKG
jgi:hypothetical protein